MRRLLLGILCFIFLFDGTPVSANALAKRFSVHNERSAVIVDHSAWDGLLGRFVRVGANGLNVVDYAKFASSGGKALKGYLSMLQGVAVSNLRRDEQFAFWVNLYNALTVEVVLAHYPVESIRDIDISPGFFANGPWGKKLVSVEGVALSLDDIEHKILRPIWQDPRIHYAVNCASVGCPNLASKAYRAEGLDAMLETAARSYVNSPRGVRVDDGEVTASKIYRWYGEDFGTSTASLLSHLRKYAAPRLRAKLRIVEDIDDYAYDWQLNDVRR